MNSKKRIHRPDPHGYNLYNFLDFYPIRATFVNRFGDTTVFVLVGVFVLVEDRLWQDYRLSGIPETAKSFAVNLWCFLAGFDKVLLVLDYYLGIEVFA